MIRVILDVHCVIRTPTIKDVRIRSKNKHLCTTRADKNDWNPFTEKNKCLGKDPPTRLYRACYIVRVPKRGRKTPISLYNTPFRPVGLQIYRFLCLRDFFVSAYLRGYSQPPNLPPAFGFNNFFNWSIKIRQRAVPKIYRARRWPLRAFKLVSIRFIHETHTAYYKRVLAPDPVCALARVCFCVCPIRIIYVHRIGYYIRTE